MRVARRSSPTCSRRGRRSSSRSYPRRAWANTEKVIQVTHFHIDLWEEKQDHPQRFIKWFESYARKKKTKILRIEVFERDAKTYDLVQVLRGMGYAPTATGFMKGRSAYELQKKL